MPSDARIPGVLTNIPFLFQDFSQDAILPLVIMPAPGNFPHSDSLLR